MGKTALAAEAVERLASADAPSDQPPERFPDGILFHTFYGQPQVDLASEKIALAYGLEPKPTPQEAAQRALSNRQALLILDGAENADYLGKILQVRGRCCVLITSRSRRDAPADFEQVLALPPEDATELFRLWSDKQAGSEATVDSICELLGGLPLALRIAGRYLAQTDLDAVDYLGWLRKSPLAALDLGQRQQDSALLVLRRSVEQLSTEAQCVLTVVGYLAPAPFRPEFIAAALNLEAGEAGRLLGELVSYSLVQRGGQRYAVTHPLIHTYARKNPCEDVPAGALAKLAGYFQEMVKHQSSKGAIHHISLDPESVHLLAVIRHCLNQRQWKSALQLTHPVEDYLDLIGRFSERITAIELGLIAAKAIPDFQAETELLGRLGSSYLNLGRTELAIERFQQAIAMARSIDFRAGEGSLLSDLGCAYHSIGQVYLGIDRIREALAIAREVNDRIGEGVCLGNLGVAYRSVGQLEKAINCHQKALAIACEIGNRRGESAALDNLGGAYRDLGQTEQAINNFQRALNIALEIGDRRGQETFLGNLGTAFHDAGRLGEAIDHYQESLKISREIGSRRGEGAHLSQLGTAFHDMGQLEHAIDHLKRALTIARDIGDRGMEGANLGNLGSTYLSQGKIENAIEYFQQALDIAREIGDRCGEGVQLGNLGSSHKDLGQTELAIAYHKEALTVAREIGNRRNEAIHLGQIGIAHYDLGAFVQAADYYQQAVVITREIDDSGSEGQHLANLGCTFHSMGQVNRARDCLQQALAIFEEIKSPNADLVRKSLAGLE